MSVIQPNADAISSLSGLPFFSAEELEGFKAELPTYLAKATKVAPNLSCLDWWNQSQTSLPHWLAAARRVLSVQLSSAVSERVFSLLNSCFNDQQQSSLQDYVETSVMFHTMGDNDIDVCLDYVSVCCN